MNNNKDCRVGQLTTSNHDRQTFTLCLCLTLCLSVNRLPSLCVCLSLWVSVCVCHCLWKNRCQPLVLHHFVVVFDFAIVFVFVFDFVFVLVFDFLLVCKNQIFVKNLRILAQWWTLCESHLMRLYFGVFQPSVVSNEHMYMEEHLPLSLFQYFIRELCQAIGVPGIKIMITFILLEHTPLTYNLTLSSLLIYYHHHTMTLSHNCIIVILNTKFHCTNNFCMYTCINATLHVYILNYVLSWASLQSIWAIIKVSGVYEIKNAQIVWKYKP